MLGAIYHAAFIRLLMATDNPWLCSGLYSVAPLLFGFLLGGSFLHVIGFTIVCFILSSAYFWLLNELDDGGAVWWILSIAGVFCTAVYIF